MADFGYLVLSTRNPDPTWMDSDRKFNDRSEALDWAEEKVRDGYAYVSLTIRNFVEHDEVTVVLHGSAG